MNQSMSLRHFRIRLASCLCAIAIVNSCVPAVTMSPCLQHDEVLAAKLWRSTKKSSPHPENSPSGRVIPVAADGMQFDRIDAGGSEWF